FANLPVYAAVCLSIPYPRLPPRVSIVSAKISCSPKVTNRRPITLCKTHCPTNSFHPFYFRKTGLYPYPSLIPCHIPGHAPRVQAPTSTPLHILCSQPYPRTRLTISD